MNKRCKLSVQEDTKTAHERKHLFPTVYRSYSLLLNAPVSVAKDERTFSKLKIIKISLRSKMKDNCLNDIILLVYEKDLTGTISLEDVLKNRTGGKCVKCRLDKIKVIIFGKIKLYR